MTLSIQDPIQIFVCRAGGRIDLRIDLSKGDPVSLWVDAIKTAIHDEFDGMLDGFFRSRLRLEEVPLSIIDVPRYWEEIALGTLVARLVKDKHTVVVKEEKR